MVDKIRLLIPPPVAFLITGFAMWGITLAWPSLAVSLPLQMILSGALIGIGLTIDFVSIMAFRKAKTTVTPLMPEKASSLVVSGLYRFTRNPMYLGLFLILSGIAVFLGSLANIAVLVAFVAYITIFQIKPEELRLSALFGSDYDEYMKRVRRWL